MKYDGFNGVSVVEHSIMQDFAISKSCVDGVPFHRPNDITTVRCKTCSMYRVISVDKPAGIW